jgi:rhodanese-related sulfurtransferase
MTVRAVSPEDAWRITQETGGAIFDLRTRAERRKFGYPPGSRKVSFFWHSIAPNRHAIYLCQHAVRSKLPASRGATEIAGGFVAWIRDSLPIDGYR